MKNIYVGNLPFQATEDELRNHFGKHGKVERVAMPHDPVTGKPRGFAFVEMLDDVEAVRAIHALNGSTFGGRTMVVNEAHSKGGRRFGRG